MSDLNKAQSNNDELLAQAISDLDGTSIDEVKNFLKDPTLREQFLQMKKALAKEKNNKANALLLLLQETEELEATQKAEKENQKFMEVEKRVLNSLSPAKRKKVKTMRKYALDHDGDYFETSYRQFILMTDSKEVVETESSVQFLYAHKELEIQELQLPKTYNNTIFDYSYTGFVGEPITRREIRQHVLDKEDDDYHCIQEVQERLAKEGKYIATEENTFNAILG